MNASKKQVLVVPTNVLFNIIGGHYFGFKRLEHVILGELIKSAEWCDREKAENNRSYRQIICYCTIVNRKNRVFAYARSTKDEAYPEKRLQGKISWGIGGHIKPQDGPIAPDIFISNIYREVREEIELVGEQSLSKIRLAGGISDNDDVGLVHFGLFFMVYSSTTTIKPKDPEIAIGKLVHPDVLKFACEFPGIEVEGWSRICQPEILRLLKE